MTKRQLRDEAAFLSYGFINEYLRFSFNLIGSSRSIILGIKLFYITHTTYEIIAN